MTPEETSDVPPNWPTSSPSFNKSTQSSNNSTISDHQLPSTNSTSDLYTSDSITVHL